MGLKSKINGNIGEDIIKKTFASANYWVHVVKRDRQGSQPFDIIAAKGMWNGSDRVWFVDCKYVERGGRFDFSDIQPNQIEAFTFALERANIRNCGFAIVFAESNSIRFLPFMSYSILAGRGERSVRAEELAELATVLAALRY